MRPKQQTPEQIRAKLAAVERLMSGGRSEADACGDVNTTTATYLHWRKRFGSLEPAEVTRLNELECENATLKVFISQGNSTIAELRPAAEMQLVSLAHKREAVRHLQKTLGLSERFACRIVGQHRATQRR